MLCKNEDCSPIKTDIYDEKCSICVGYYKDDGTNDILYLTENGGEGECELCGKTKNICIMKESGQHICANACDESDDSEESDESDD